MANNTDKELFKWFLASILFGARISETIAKHTYRTFQHYRLLTPQKIQQAGWDYLVDPIMREGGYVRYDGKTSSTLLQICETLLDEYHGSLLTLHDKAHDQLDLEKRLNHFYGVGPTTVNIFLRELRPYWTKSDPEPLPFVKEAADSLGIDLTRFRRKTITFTRIEAGLIRFRKELKKHKN